jgi:hypothetical protein
MSLCPLFVHVLHKYKTDVLYATLIIHNAACRSMSDNLLHFTQTSVGEILVLPTKTTSVFECVRLLYINIDILYI